MEKGRPSETAALAAMLRAAHPLLDSKPWVLEDDLAAPLSGIDGEGALRIALSTFEDGFAAKFPRPLVQAWIRYARAIATSRARYVEDELSQAIKRGMSQYVILGSGFDSFAYRRRDLGIALQVFEVDYLATQQKKEARLRELHIEIPAYVTFVPLDFERQSIMERLIESGFRSNVPAFFSWLGVTPYLTAAAFARTLEEVASAADGSEILFDYALPLELVDAESRQILGMAESLTAAGGEPVHSYFEPSHLAARMRELGFVDIRDLDADEANARYFAGRTDGLRFPQLVRILKAQVNRGTRS